jgi:hypothetical protein
MGDGCPLQLLEVLHQPVFEFLHFWRPNFEIRRGPRDHERSGRAIDFHRYLAAVFKPIAFPIEYRDPVLPSGKYLFGFWIVPGQLNMMLGSSRVIIPSGAPASVKATSNSPWPKASIAASSWRLAASASVRESALAGRRGPRQRRASFEVRRVI